MNQSEVWEKQQRRSGRVIKSFNRPSAPQQMNLGTCWCLEQSHIFSVTPFFFCTPQSSVQPLSQPGPERNLQPPPVSQQPVPTQDPPETEQPSRLQFEQQRSDHQQRAKPHVLKRRQLLVPLLGFFLSAAFVGLFYYIIHSLRTNNCQAEKGRSP